jgi:hypothetical protein
MKKFAYTVLTAAMVGGVTFGTGGAANAAHCTGTTAEEKSQPGFSYFGQEGRDEGAPRGASACREATGSPSERAPGKPR